MTVAERRATFRRLHETGCFVLPNPWDVGTARYLEHLGFRAVATTSAGAAFALGLPDGGMSRDAMLAHLETIVAATGLPVNADFQNGYADAPDAVAENVRRCIATGVAGLSIEDATGDPARPFYARALAAERVAAARAAIDASGSGVVLTGRAEGMLAHDGDLDDVIGRLRAYAAAGADCLFAPGLRTPDQIRAAVGAVAPKPVNLLLGAMGLTVADAGALGVRRISLGSGLARAAWGGFLRAARGLANEGRFDALADATPHGELNAFFVADHARTR